MKHNLFANTINTDRLAELDGEQLARAAAIFNNNTGNRVQVSKGGKRLNKQERAAAFAELAEQSKAE